MEIGSLVANAGTPLMWTGCFMLTIGNYLIGLMEYRIITRGHTWPKTTWNPMILANYASMAAGVGLLYAAEPILKKVADRPFELGLCFIVSAWVATYLLTVLVEWPFVAKAAGLRIAWKSLKISFWVQAISYTMLILIVHLTGSVSALTGLRNVPASEIKTVAGWVYYMDRETSDMHRVRLDGSSTEFVARFEYKPDPNWSRVTVEPSPEADHARVIFRSSQRQVILKDVGSADQSAPVDKRDDQGFAILGNDTFGRMATRKFRSYPNAYAGYWPREGLVVDDDRYALETPFLPMPWRNVIVLPDGKVVAQFGDVIVLIDHERGHVAHLALGQGGDVLIDKAKPDGQN